MRWRNTQPLPSILDRHPRFLDTGWPTASRVEKPYARPNELLKILVARDNHDIHTLLRSLPGKGTNDVIGFVALEREHRNAIRIEDLGDAFHSSVEVALELFGQFLPRCLVGGIALMSKAQPGIVHPTEILWLMRYRESLNEVDDSPRR